MIAFRFCAEKKNFWFCVYLSDIRFCVCTTDAQMFDWTNDFSIFDWTTEVWVFNWTIEKSIVVKTTDVWFFALMKSTPFLLNVQTAILKYYVLVKTNFFCNSMVSHQKTIVFLLLLQQIICKASIDLFVVNFLNVFMFHIQKHSHVILSIIIIFSMYDTRWFHQNLIFTIQSRMTNRALISLLI
jgi:hypothetical protein